MNASVLEDLFKQGGMGDSSKSSGVKDIGDQVIIVHGDLLTSEQVRGLQETQSEETSPWRWHQFIVYVMGLFHLKILCTDEWLLKMEDQQQSAI